MIIKRFDPQYRDDLIFMVLEAKKRPWTCSGIE